jgi:hypothetical protein
LASQLYVACGRLPRSLFERVEHIDRLRELGDVQHPMLQRRVDSDFPDARPDGKHGLPIERPQALLETPELKADQSSGVPGESPNIGARTAEPLERLVSHGSICKYSYN